MQIIKNDAIISDNWQYITDDSALGVGNICVSCTRLLQSAGDIFKREGLTGVRISPDDSVAAIEKFLPQLALIELYFPDLSDGRLFSHAWLLRKRYHYTGELRAAGHFVPDQVYYLSRVGVSSFDPENAEHLPAALKGLRDFSVSYQTSCN